MPTLHPVAGASMTRRTLLALSTVALARSAAGAQSAPRAQGSNAGVPQPAAAGISLRGTVYDSLARGPLAGAMVQAVRVDNTTSARTASTDSTGAFQLDSLSPGRYLLGFFHPTLDALSVQITPMVVVVDTRPLPAVALAVPGPNTMHAAVCPPNTPGDSTGAVAGAVRNALTGDAPAGATVVLSWTELSVTRAGLARERHRVPVRMQEDGGFLVCGVPNDEAIQLSVAAPGLTSGLVEVTVPARGLVVQRFAVGPVAPGGASPGDSVVIEDAAGVARPAPGTARLAGSVVGPDGQPLRGARVRVWGMAAHTETGPDGRFTLAGLPSGTFTVEVLGSGLEPSRTPVDLANGQTATLRVALATRAATP